MRLSCHCEWSIPCRDFMQSYFRHSYFNLYPSYFPAREKIVLLHPLWIATKDTYAGEFRHQRKMYTRQSETLTKAFFPKLFAKSCQIFSVEIPNFAM